MRFISYSILQGQEKLPQSSDDHPSKALLRESLPTRDSSSSIIFHFFFLSLLIQPVEYTYTSPGSHSAILMFNITPTTLAVTTLKTFTNKIATFKRLCPPWGSCIAKIHLFLGTGPLSVSNIQISFPKGHYPPMRLFYLDSVKSHFVSGYRTFL